MDELDVELDLNFIILFWFAGGNLWPSASVHAGLLITPFLFLGLFSFSILWSGDMLTYTSCSYGHLGWQLGRGHKNCQQKSVTPLSYLAYPKLSLSNLKLHSIYILLQIWQWSCYIYIIWRSCKKIPDWDWSWAGKTYPLLTCLVDSFGKYIWIGWQ